MPPRPYLDHEKVDLQFCNPPPNAASSPVAEGDGPEIVNPAQVAWPQPALRPELLGPREVLILVGGGIVAEGQLGLSKPFSPEK